MAKILVTGSNGQLGSELRELSSEYAHRFVFTDRDTLDITDSTALEKLLKEESIDTIINCAAYTAVDKAEEEQDTVDTINHIAVKNIAELCKQYAVKLIHISTDYVFDGQNYRPYIETDPTNPQSIYGKTKLAGEEAIKASGINATIIRTSWVYSSYGSNFVKTMLRLGKERDELSVIFDQVGTPTYAYDLAKSILDKVDNLKKSPFTIYHYSNEGVLSWYDFAKEIMKMAKLECSVTPIETKDYPTSAKRPNYSVLNKSKIKQELGITIPYWKDSLSQCLIKLGARTK